MMDAMKLATALRKVCEAAHVAIGRSNADIYTDAPECEGEVQALSDAHTDLLDAVRAAEPLLEDMTLIESLVQAKVDYWDKLRAVEKRYAPDGEFSDTANNELIEYIDSLAAGTDSAVSLDVEHIAEVQRRAKL